MRDWTGTRAQSDALAVRCRDCGAEPGELCVNRGEQRPLQAFPAHQKRITDARKAAANVG
ncbi:zinc finger domain-containing protein [Mycobacterium malmoense]|uniref:zinc finger domain-containing protein n=1 Tax=Mycobacterium malmoense TaxID=1780 RepID=UPI0008F8A37F|nr:hypothetical protein [Mycobacterium malmoense]OIN80189.1 hypothetical protein BMG05_13145 [Mycobacterium malmoense]